MLAHRRLRHSLALPLLALFFAQLVASDALAQNSDPKKRLTAAQRAKARYHMDFDKVDILEVIKYISQWTNKNFILPDNVRGKISIIGPDEVTANEAYQAFLAALETNNLTVTPTGKFLKIVPKKDSPQTGGLPLIVGDESVPLDERMVTRLYRLKYSEADPIKNVLQQFVSREGSIVPFPPDLLILSDTGLNQARIERLIEELDQPGSQDEINTLQVENANAQDLANTLLQIFQPQTGTPTPAARARPRPRPTARGATTTAPAEQDAAGASSVSKIIPDERTNKLIVVASARAFARIRELARKLDVPTDTGQVHVYYLENAAAEELASTLSSLASGQSSGPTTGRQRAQPAAANAAGATSASLFSGDVKVTADKATNSLLITASPADFRAVSRVIQKLDLRRRQVFIEAVIMEVKLNGQNRFSVDVHGGYGIEDVQLPGTNSSTVPLFVGSEVSSPGASLNLAGLASLSGFLAGLQGPPIEIQDLGIKLPSFGVVLNALQRNSDVNVISTPHILTTDNEEAEITVGSNVPFQAAFAPNLGPLTGLAGGTGTSAAGGLSSLFGGVGGLGSLYAPIQRQPVELRLKLKPQINESDFVRLEVDEQVEEISSIDPQLGPTTAKRSVKTVIVAKDQSTVVIGGLIQERITRSETKVPILGSLPIVGALFRSTNNTKERTNLLLFLTPYIIRDQADFRRIFERKMKERKEFVARFFGASEEYAVAIDWDRKQGPLAALRESVADTFEKAEYGGPGGRGQTVVRPGDMAREKRQNNRNKSDVDHPEDDDEPIPVEPGTIRSGDGGDDSFDDSAPVIEAPPVEPGPDFDNSPDLHPETEVFQAPQE